MDGNMERKDAVRAAAEKPEASSSGLKEGMEKGMEKDKDTADSSMSSKKPEKDGKKDFVKKSWKEVAAERREQLKAITDRLEAGVKEYMANDVQFKKVLETMAKFHHYSANNILLISMQMPEATHVASYTNWQKKFNRQVKRGQKGISIIAPAPYKKKTEREVTDPATGRPVLDGNGNPKMEEVEITVPRFKVAKVFDASQTFGEPLPELDVPELEGNAENYGLFMDALRSASPAPIRFDAIEGGAKGYYDNRAKEIVIKEGMSEIQTVKTAIHEIAHARLHDRDIMREQGDIMSQQVKELEAEAVAFTVLFRFKIDSSDYSIPYLGSWSGGQDTKTLHESMDTIRITASQIIDEVTDYMAERMKEREAAREDSHDEDRFTVYQIIEDSPGRDILFMEMEYVKENGLEIRPEYYRQVYEAPLKPDDTLDTLYARFNEGNYPEDYRGHSMSMSDVIVMSRSGEEHAFYVDRMGFQEVPEFLREQQTLEDHAQGDHALEDLARDSASPEIREDTAAERDIEKAAEINNPDGKTLPEKGTEKNIPDGKELPEETAEKSFPDEKELPEETAEKNSLDGEELSEERRETTSEPVMTYYVAECMDFPVMGKYHDNLTLEQAVQLYQDIPDGGMNGGKGIGYRIDDGNGPAVSVPLIASGKLQESAFDSLDHSEGNVKLKEALAEARAALAPLESTKDTAAVPAKEDTRTQPEQQTDTPGTAGSRDPKPAPGKRRESVLADLRAHQRKIHDHVPTREERARTAQHRKGEPAL